VFSFLGRHFSPFEKKVVLSRPFLGWRCSFYVLIMVILRGRTPNLGRMFSWSWVKIVFVPVWSSRQWRSLLVAKLGRIVDLPSGVQGDDAGGLNGGPNTLVAHSGLQRRR
jgi:hypothetical protein